MTEVDERHVLAKADDARLMRLRDRKALRTVGLIFGAAVGAGIAGTLIAILL